MQLKISRQQVKFFPFLERKPVKNSVWKKDDKVGNKTEYKKKGNGEKNRARIKVEVDSPCSKNKKAALKLHPISRKLCPYRLLF